VGPLDSDRADEAISEHHLIADAIARGDGQNAEDLARAHVARTARRLQELRDEPGETST
jgi:DNA-binding GntR family transcriptional regulator